MPGKYADTYELSAGMHDDTNAVIQFGTFRTDAAYMGGNILLLVLTLTDEAGEPFDQMLSIGADWQTSDGGDTVQHPSGPNKKFGKQSNYGKWLTACQQIPELWDVITDRGPANDSRIWEGIKVHVVTREETYKMNGEDRTRTALLPDAYLGVESSNGSAPGAPVQQPLQPAALSGTVELTPQQRIEAAKAAAASKTQPSDPRMSELASLARSSADHQDFLIKALDLDWVVTDDELTGQLADPSGFFAQARS